MKIYIGAEPLYCDAGDAAFHIVTALTNTNTDADLMDCVRRHTPLNLESMIQLSDWKAALNKLDSRLEAIMNKWKKVLVLTADSKLDDVVDVTGLESDVADLKSILKFTSQLLRSAINKEVYNSTEYLIELLCAYDDDLVVLAMDALLALALPPLSHRCNLDMTRHVTALHKTAAQFDSLFEIVEASLFATSVPIAEFLSDDFDPTADMKRAKVDFRTRSKYVKTVLVSDSNGVTSDIEALLAPNNAYEIADVWENPQSLREVTLKTAAELTFGLKFSLMCAVRMRRLMQTKQGRTTLVRLQYQATAILLGCHPESSALSNYFEDKIGLFKSFMYLLRTGPGSLDYRPDLVPLDIRLLAVHSLEAVVGSRDNSSNPVVARYPWIIQDLGINRGQYMGMLPSIVRSMTSFLVSLDAPQPLGGSSQQEAVEDGSAAVESKMDVDSEVRVPVPHDFETGVRLAWIENVFMLLIAVVNMPSALPALADNGLVGSLLLVLERLQLRGRSATMMYVEILCVETLEGLITSHGPAMTLFKEKKGMEIVIDRLHRELQHCLVDEPPRSTPLPLGVYHVTRASTGCLSTSSSIIIQEFFSLLTSVLQENLTAASDAQWYKLPALVQSFRLILSHAYEVGSLVLSPAISLLAEIINSDPAPPTILSYMMSAGICRDAVLILTGRAYPQVQDGEVNVDAALSVIEDPAREISFSNDLVLSALCLLSSMSLTADGIALVQKMDPFGALFALFTDPRYVYPQSRVLMTDVPNMMGTHMEELVRHYPVYLPLVMKHLVGAMASILKMADAYISDENYRTGAKAFDSEYQSILHYAVGILLCLEALLLNQPTIEEFKKCGGFEKLHAFLKVGFGPPRFLLDQFACVVESTVSCMAYTPVMALVVSRCMNRIGEVERVMLVQSVLGELQRSVADLQDCLQDHATHHHMSESLPAGMKKVPPTLGGNANPVLEGLLDTVTREPMQECCDEDQMTPRLLSYAKVIRGFGLVDLLVDALGIVFNAQRGPGVHYEECLALLLAPTNQQLIEAILSKLYLPSILEMARARGQFMNSSKDSCVRAHPVYHLMVVAAENVAVRADLDDTSARVCKLGRGCIVQAYERRCGGSNGTLKYRTKAGWISVFKGNQINEPQVLVVKVSKKNEQDYAEEVSRNHDVYEDAEKRFEFEKFANVSAKRGGFLALYHFNHSVKAHLLPALTRNFFTGGTLLGPQDGSTISPLADQTIPVLVSCVRAMIPQLTNPTPRSALDLETLTTAAANATSPPADRSTGRGAAAKRSRFARSASSSSSSAVEEPASAMSVTASNTLLKERFFQKDAVPLLDECTTSQVYMAIRLSEFVNTLLFEQRRGRLEMNPLVMAHLVYDVDCSLESVFYAMNMIFLCSLPDVTLETVDKPEHHRLYQGPWYPLKEADLDKEPDAAVTGEGTSSAESAATVNAAAKDSDTGKGGKGKGKGRKGAAKSKAVEEDKGAAFAPYPDYLTYRRALRERRLLAVGSVDNTVNLWKLLCSTLNPPTTATERIMQRECDDEHDFDPLAMKRWMLTTASKHLHQVWSHPQLHSLPPTTVKNVIDLMAVVIKALSDHKSVSSLRSTLPPSVFGSGGGNPFDVARLARAGAARRVPAFGASSAAQAPPADDFVVSEECIAAVQEMGFARSSIIRAATMLRTNNANHIVPHLLENPFMFADPEPAAPVRSSTTTAAAPAPAAATSESQPAAASGSAAASSAAPQAAASTTDSSDGLPPSGRALGTAAGLAQAIANGRQALDLLAAARGADSSSSSASGSSGAKGKSSQAAKPGRSALPLVPKQLDVTLKLERDLLQRVLKCVYGDVPVLCVALIERGPSELLGLLDADMRTVNAGVTRELFTVMVLNQMLKCLEKNNLPDGLLRIVQLSWLYQHAVNLLKDGPLNTDSMGALFGLLHAILVLLTSKITSGTTRTPSTCNELLYLIFTQDTRYSKLYPLLVDALERISFELDAAGVDGVDAARTAWAAPALLILDIAAQPILVDPAALRSSMAELDGYVKYNPQSSLTSVTAGIVPTDDSILSSQVRELLTKTFLSKKSTSLSGFPSFDDMLFTSGAQRAHGRSFDGIFDFAAPSATSGSAASGRSTTPARRGRGRNADNSSTPMSLEASPPAAEGAPTQEGNLPLFDSAITAEVKMRALTVSVSLLRMVGQVDKPESAALAQAAMQLVAHLTRTPALRKMFHEHQGGVTVLRCKARFEGMPSLVFTLLQQVLEDDNFLTMSMLTAVRLCLLRLGERKSKSVLLKNFLEVICPVVLREQALFVKVLKDHTELKEVGGQVYISWKEPSKEKDGVATGAANGSSSALVPSQGVATQQPESAATAGSSADSSAPAAAAATATVPASAAKRQRLQDGSAVTTSTVQAEAKSAPTSGIKSGAKRVLTSSGHETAGASALSKVTSPLLHSDTVTVVVDELLSRIVCKWLQVRSMDAHGNTALPTDAATLDTSLSIESMLIIAADLVAAQPVVSLSVLRYVFNVAKVPAWAKELAKVEFPIKHVISGQSLGGLFVTFVVHALLLPARLVSWDESSLEGLSAEAATKQREARDAKLAALTGSSLRNACSYFLAALASRPGEGRKRVLNEVLNGGNAGAQTISRTAQLRSLVAVAEALQYLMQPPSEWTSRDAFILPVKDIMSTLAKLNAHGKLAASICAVDMAHPLALETVMVLTVPLDAMIKKGLEPTPESANATAATEVPKPPLHPLGMSYAETRVGFQAATSAAPSQITTASTVASGASGMQSSQVSSAAGATAAPAAANATTTPAVRRTAGASSTAAASNEDGIVRLASSDGARPLVTPATNRRRGGTEQSMDTEDRQLLMQDQHDHLLRPENYRHSSDEDEMDGDEGDVDAEDLGFMDAGGMDGPVVYEEGDGSEGDEDMEDGFEGGDESGSDEDGEVHHHGGSDDGDSDDSDGDSGAEEAVSHSDGSDNPDSDGSGSEFSDDDDGDIDDSREYPVDEDVDDDDDGDSDASGDHSDDDEPPELEISVELDHQHGDDGEDGEGDGSDGSDGDEGEEGSDLADEELLEEEGDEEDLDEDINDDEADVSEEDGSDGDEGDEDGLSDADDADLIRHAVRRVRRGMAAEEDEEGEEVVNEGEHQGEGDDDGGNDEMIIEMDTGDDMRLGNQNSMDFGHGDDEAELAYDHYGAQMNEEDGEGGNNEGDDDAGADDEGIWSGSFGGRRAPAARNASRFLQSADNGDGEEIHISRSTRQHDRSRRLSAGGQSGQQGVLLSNIIDSIRNHHQGRSGSGIFSIPAGSVISGGVLQTDDGHGGGEMITFDNAGGGDLGPNIGALLSNILPPNVTVTTSTARVDPRTGAVTFSIGGTRGDATSGGSNSLDATAVQPPAHPLLAVTDARRNRFLQPCVNGMAAAVSGGRASALTRAAGGLAVVGSGGISTFDASSRRGQLSVRRREVGPIVSDRRWGTDIGDLEPAGARLGALTAAVESALADVIQKEPPPEPRPRTAGRGSFRMPPGDWNDLASPPSLGGTHYESDEDDDEDGEGDGDGDEEGEGSDDAEVRAAARRGRYSYDPNETKEEDSELQETKDSEPLVRSGSSAAPPTTQVSAPPIDDSQSPAGMDGSLQESAPQESAAMEVELPAPAAEAPPALSIEPSVAPAASSEPAPAESATSSAETNAAPAFSEENLLFVESLSPELRQEVLISAEREFLQSLPPAIQAEARALRFEAGIVEDPEPPAPRSAPATFLGSVATAPAPAAAAGASALSGAAVLPLLDFSAMLRREEAPATDSASSALAPSAAGSSSGVSSSAPAAGSASELLRRLLAASGGSASSTGGSEGASAAAAPTTNSSSSSAPANPAPPVRSLEDRRAAELALTVSLGEDRDDTTLPYGAHLVARLLRSFLMSNKSKMPKSISKLLATACRYRHGRLWILRALFGSLTHGGQRVADCVRRIALEPDAPATAFEAEVKQLATVVDEIPHNAVNMHRIISGLSFLFRRTDRLSWYDIMLYPLPSEDSVWLFGSLIGLLSDPVHATGENLEYVLQVIDDLCGVFAKLTVKQANELAADTQKRLNLIRQQTPGRKVGRSVTYALAGQPMETIEEGDEESDLPKRRRLEPASPEPVHTDLQSPPTRARAASIDIEGAAGAVAGLAAKEETKAEEPLVGKERHRMPFPVLQDGDAKLLCQVVGSKDCVGNARKRIVRVTRYLSLCDTNWYLFLDHLATVGADLAGRATREFSDLREVLVDVAQNNQTAAAAMARPELSTPKGLSEVRLLNVLRTMSQLRSRSNEGAAAESEVVASRMRRIQADGLWESLCDCLDIVRDLEGIVDTADEAEKVANNAASGKAPAGAKPEDDKAVALSSLTLRFMPLIECFLTVCATTLLVRPDSVGSSALRESQRELERLSSGFKRRHSRDEPTGAGSSSSSSSAAVTASGGIRAGRFSPATPSGTGHHDLTSPATFARVNSMLPGSRFRQNPAFFQMQMELSDDAAAERLITFATQNRVLFNNVLRSNVSLLETSFSPLVSVPRCRQLLHFDIKRAFFKLKLKRIRQTAARNHGSLRVSVRRSHVFEESFQALRYKTADEMRRRLSVSFHGEEGMDAGGVTREWYGVLAREIFNPNYALFTSSGDNVTFQPNAQSYINPDHQSYFKFVGRIIGKAICDGHLLDAHFTRSFYKHMLGLPVSVVDLEAIDPEYFKSLKQILDTPLDLLGLDLTFSAESNDFGVVSTVDLIPQGRNVEVTDDTKHEYVKLLAHHRMTTAIRKQIDAFLEGFHELVPPELISIFDAQELELLISGLPDIDLDDLRAHTDYQGYKPTDPEITYFWNVLKSFSKQEKALFLQFVTGTSKVPLDGFKALQGSDGVKQFNIQKAFGGSHLLPSAHTCFNQLDLPEYPTEEMLREKLLMAIREGSEGFGFA